MRVRRRGGFQMGVSRRFARSVSRNPWPPLPRGTGLTVLWGFVGALIGGTIWPGPGALILGLVGAILYRGYRGYREGQRGTRPDE
jgi:hypothetical protein